MRSEMSTRLDKIEELAQAICAIRGVNLDDRPDLRYLAQQLVERGWDRT